MRLFLIRHGAVIPPQPQSFYGDSDVPLSPTGEAEARAAAAFLAATSIDHIASSPLARARYGAEQIAAGRNLRIEVIDGLREIKRGRWNGMTRPQVQNCWPGDLEAHEADFEHWNAHGGESRGAFRDRVLAARDALLERHRGRTVAVVSHHFTSRAILADAQGLGLAEWDQLVLPTASVSLLEYPAGGAPMVRWIGFKPDGRPLAEVFPE